SRCADPAACALSNRRRERRRGRRLDRSDRRGHTARGERAELTIRAVIFDLGHTIWDIRRDEATLARAYVEMRKTLAQRTRRDDLPDAARLQRAVRDVLRGYVETYENSDDLSQPATHTFVDEAFRTLALELPEAVLIEITGPLFATEIDGLVCKDG